jgi:excisionase family DNA binding protein
MVEPLDILRGWKEISTYLGVEKRTAQRWAKYDQLPYYQPTGPRGSVLANREELNRWMERNTALVHPPADAETRVAEIPAPPAALRRPIYVGAAAAGVLVVSVLFIYSMAGRRPALADFTVHGRNLIAVDSRGGELWRHQFPDGLIESDYTEPLRAEHTWIGNLDGKGGCGLIFIADPWNRSAAGTETICFNGAGGWKWKFMPGAPVVNRAGKQMQPPFLANSVQVMPAPLMADTRIAVSSNHYVDEANQVAFLDVDGRVRGEYWHPGHLLHLTQADLDHNGSKQLLLGGVNNGSHQATLVILDPLKISGAVSAAKMEDHRFEIVNMKPANERAVVFFPRSCVSTGQTYNRVGWVYVTKDRIVVVVSESSIDDGPGFIYQLDFDLRVINVVPSNAFMIGRLHRELEAQGSLNHEFDSDKECARLKAGVVVLRGETQVEPGSTQVLNSASR